MYSICSLFAICSFTISGTGLFRPLVAQFEFGSGLISNLAANIAGETRELEGGFYNERLGRIGSSLSVGVGY